MGDLENTFIRMNTYSINCSRHLLSTVVVSWSECLYVLVSGQWALCKDCSTSSVQMDLCSTGCKGREGVIGTFRIRSAATSLHVLSTGVNYYFSRILRQNILEERIIGAFLWKMFACIVIKILQSITETSFILINTGRIKNYMKHKLSITCITTVI